MKIKQVYEVIAISKNSILSFRFDNLADARKKEKELKRGNVMVLTFEVF
jgi:hypothetical protein